MEGQLIFCKDGILRFKSWSDETKLVPLILIQKYLGEENYPFFLRKLRGSFILEEGSTVGSFLLCLEPWAEVASAITDRQVDKYIAELRKPSSEKQLFDRIEMRKIINFHRTMIHEPCPEGVDWLEHLNRPNKKIEYADTYTVSHSYSICGANDGDATNWSMSASIHALKNVPLTLNRSPLVIGNAGLLNGKGPGVKDTPEWKKSRYANCVDDEEMTAMELVEVVIAHGLWFDTPQGAIREREVLNAIMAELPEDLAELGTAVQGSEETVEAEDGPKRIEIAPGAFDAVIESSKRERSAWEQMMDVVQSTSQFPFRIGKVEEGKPKDNRAFGKFFE